MVAPLKVFLSYSHQDKELCLEFESHLNSLKREGLIDVWTDHQILAGSEWDTTIEGSLNDAEIILLLISSDFIQSNYAYDKEMAIALELHQSEKAIVVPIIIRPVEWEGLPFSKLQVLPSAGKPVTKWNTRDEGWLNIVQGLRKLINNSKDKIQQRRMGCSEIAPLGCLITNQSQTEEGFNQHSESMEGCPAKILIALLKDCPDGLSLKRYKLSELLDMFPSESQEAIQEACYDLENDGLLRVQPEMNDIGLTVRLEEYAYEQFDYQIMGWNPLEDAVELAKLMIETNDGTASTLQNTLGWSKRRFNPAQRLLVDIVPNGCVRDVNQADFVKIGVLITPESKACLKYFIRENQA